MIHRMFKIGWVLLPVSLMAAIVAGGCKAEGGRSKDEAIFDGKTLKGWHTQGDPDVWSVQDGAIVGEANRPSPYAYLVSDKSFENFELTVQMRYETNSGNSGVFFWSTFPPQCSKCDHIDGSLPEDSMQMACPKDGQVEPIPLPKRVNIYGVQAEFAPPNNNTGAVYDSRVGKWANPDQLTENLQKQHKFGEWNEMRIIAQGRSVKVYLNGVLTSDIPDYDFPKGGHIALQLHSGDVVRVRFKDLKLRTLPAVAEK